MRWRLLAAMLAFVLFAAACGDDGSTAAGGDADAGDDGSDDDSSGGDGADSDGASDDVGDDGDGDGADGSADSTGEDDAPLDNNATGDEEDLADIIGNEDLDPDAADGLGDDIDDIVSLGDCVIETLGLVADVQEGMECRVLDNPIPGFDGFSMFNAGSSFVITIGSPSPIDICAVGGLCGELTPVDIPGFSDAMTYEIVGTGALSASHDTYEVDLEVTSTSPFTDEDLDTVRRVAESLRMP